LFRLSHASGCGVVAGEVSRRFSIIMKSARAWIIAGVDLISDVLAFGRLRSREAFAASHMMW
jgi:hypothetical protein